MFFSALLFSFKQPVGWRMAKRKKEKKVEKGEEKGEEGGRGKGNSLALVAQAVAGVEAL